MFQNLMNLQFQRSGWQPVGFYIAYLFLFALIGGGIAGAVGVINPSLSSYRVGWFVATVVCPTLAIMVLKSKGQVGHFANWMLVVLSLLLAVMGGYLLGFIPVAWLTTRPNLNTQGAL